MSQIMQALNIHPHTFFLMSINILIVIFVLYKLLFKPLGRVMEDRKNKISQDFHQAAMANKRAWVAEVRSQERLSSARYQAKDIISKAHEAAEKIGDDIRQDAHKEARNIRKRAERHMEEAQERALEEMEDQVTSLSIEIAKKILGKEIDPALHQELIQSFLDDARKLT